MWGRLSLRWQVAFAVLVPSLAVALFSGFYFPKEQQRLGLQRLEDRTRIVGLLASNEISTLLNQAGVVSPDSSGPQPVASGEGGLRAVQLPHVFERVEQVGSVSFQAVLTPAGKVLSERGIVPKDLKGGPHEGEACSLVRLQGNPVAFCGLSGGHTYVVGMDAAVVKAETESTHPPLFVYLGAMVVGLFITFFIGRAIAEPVTRMTQAAREVSQGDLSLSEMDVASAGEVRMMAHSFNEMLGTLRVEADAPAG